MKSYVIVNRDNKFSVFEADADQKPTGQAIGEPHDTEEAAQSAVRDLKKPAADEAPPADTPAEDEAEGAADQKDYAGAPASYDFTVVGEAVKFTQAEVDYTIYAVRKNPVNAVCQTCRNFTARRTREGAFIRHECAIVECHPLDIVATGWCNKWTERPQETMTPPLEVVVIGDISDDADSAELVGEMSTPVDNLTIGRYPSKKVLQEEAKLQASSSFKAIGNRVWIAAHTNAYVDKQREIIPLAEHKKHVARVKAGLWPMPELWHWHLKGTRHGQVVWYDMIGNMVVAIGLFDDTPAGRKAEKYYQQAKPGEVTMSHGFLYDPSQKKGGVYGAYNTFEITTLPAGAEANPYTAFQAVKELNMSKHVSDTQAASIKRVFGDAADTIISQLEPIGEADEALKALGIAHKGFFADVTEGATEAAQAKAGDPAADSDLTALLGDMIKVQGSQALNQINLIKGVNRIIKHIERLDKQLDNAPLSVENSRTLEEGDGADKAAMDKAAAELAEKQKTQPPTDEWGSFFPGLSA